MKRDEEKRKSIKKKICPDCKGQIETLVLDTILLRTLQRCKNCGVVFKINVDTIKELLPYR